MMAYNTSPSQSSNVLKMIEEDYLKQFSASIPEKCNMKSCGSVALA